MVRYPTPQCAARYVRRGQRLALVLALAASPSTLRAQDRGDGLRVSRSATTGLASFVTAADGGPIPLNVAPVRRRVEPVDFLVQHGHRFGVTNPTTELALTRTESDALGHRHTTYAQVHKGIRVFSGVLKVHQNAMGQIVAANGDFYPIAPKLGTTPTLTAAEAGSVAAATLAGAKPATERSELVIVDPGWYGDPPLGARLAYHIVLTDAAVGVCEAFFVEAHDGSILDRWELTRSAIDRSVHDAGGTAELPGPLARGEGDPRVADADVNAAYDYLGDTYDYYWRAFGRDGIDDEGMTIVATVNSTALSCPNSGWSFTLLQTAFCQGTVTDDLVAHEMTHGVTQFSANLLYQNQSGQLNESFSDVFGELVDLFNGDVADVGAPGGPPYWPTHPTGPGTDTPNKPRVTCSPKPEYADGVRWLIGEDGNTSAPFDGAFRDMWDPTCLGHPDRANSPLQTCDLSDHGGVHSGCGIPNHAFAMLTDGKTFNGHTVNGIGPIKAAAVWYRALTIYLTVAADFQDAYAAFNQAAADLIGTFPDDPRTGEPSDSLFTTADAAEVDEALLAVEMNTPGACGATVPVLDSTPPLLCPSHVPLFADDFEAGSNGWTVSNSAPPTPFNWVQTTDPLPFVRPGVAWFCADPNIGDCSTNGTPEQGSHALTSPEIVMPADVNLPALTFAHYIETEYRWDGGDVAIRVNGGPWEIVPRVAFRHNPYNTTLYPASVGNTNPFAGRVSFSGAGGEWGTSLIDLGPFVTGGDTLQVRFDFGKDWCYGITGWFIDDFEVHHCPADGDCNSNGVADEIDLAQGEHQDCIVRHPPNHASGNPSDLDDGGLGATAMADNFLLLRRQAFESIRLWGGYYPDSLAPTDHFTVIFHEDLGALPGPVVASRSDVPSTRAPTGGILAGISIDEWAFELTFNNPVVLESGTYFVEILNDTIASTDTFIWERATVGDIPGAAFAYEAPGVTWGYEERINMSLELYGPVIGADCNSNSVPDECDLWGDGNGDGDTDLSDVAVFVDCLTGPGQAAPVPCRCLLDADDDEDIDLADFSALQTCVGGP